MRVYIYSILQFIIGITLGITINNYVIKTNNSFMVENCMKKGYLFYNNKVIYCNLVDLVDSKKIGGINTHEKTSND